MLDTLSGYFLCLTAHAVLVFTIFFNQEPHLMASLPFSVKVIKEEAKVEFVVLLSLTILSSLVEIGFIIYKMPSTELALFSMVSHVLSCVFLVKFVVDGHPVGDFWITFIAFSCPPLAFHLVSVFLSIRRNKT